VNRWRVLNWMVGALTLAWAMAVPSSSQAQLFGQVSSARTLIPATNDIGGYVGFFEDYTTAFGQYRRGLPSSFDFGLQFGLVDPDAPRSDASFIIGGDLKYMVLSAGFDPFDLAVGGRFSYYDVSSVSVFAAGPAIILSRDIKVSNGSFLTPYGAMSIRVEHVSFSVDKGMFPNAVDTDDTDLEIGAVGGVQWELSDLVDALGEVVLDDELGLVFGLNFKI